MKQEDRSNSAKDERSTYGEILSAKGGGENYAFLKDLRYQQCLNAFPVCAISMHYG